MKKVIIYRSSLLARSETFIRQQALALREWQPVLLGERTVPDGLNLDGLQVELLNEPRRSLVADYHYRLCRRMSMPHQATTRKIAALGADLIHVHFGIDAVDVWPQLRKLGLPVLVTLHGYDINVRRDWWESGNGGEHMRTYPRKLLELAENPIVHFIAVSNAIRDSSITYGIHPQKLTVNYIGVDTDVFAPSQPSVAHRARRILFVGRLVEKKGVDFLLHAFRLVKNNMPEAELAIVGNGPLQEALSDLAKDLQIDVEWLSSLQPDGVREQMRQARVLCAPSVTAANGDAEGLPTVIMEALSCGLPVVTSQTGGCGESTVDGVTGFRTPEGDAELIARRLELLLANDALAEEMSKSAREHCLDNFSIRRCTASLEARYQDALPAQGDRGG